MQVERDSSPLAPAADFLLPLSSFPFGLGLSEEGCRRAMRVVKLTTSLGISKKESQCPGHFSFSIPI